MWVRTGAPWRDETPLPIYNHVEGPIFGVQVMRTATLISLAALAVAGAAAAQVPTVSVSIGPKLQEKADNYGQRELDFLARELQRSVETRLARVGATGRYELVIVDAKPNRPTFEQLGDRPGLSPTSFGIGGATIEGAYIAPDGSRTPIRYRRYDGDIVWAQHTSTWADAESAFNKLGNRLARGQLYAAR